LHHQVGTEDTFIQRLPYDVQLGLTAVESKIIKTQAAGIVQDDIIRRYFCDLRVVFTVHAGQLQGSVGCIDGRDGISFGLVKDIFSQ